MVANDHGYSAQRRLAMAGALGAGRRLSRARPEFVMNAVVVRRRATAAAR